MVVIAFGLSWQTQWERNNKIHAAFPLEVQRVVAKSEQFYLYSLQPERLTDMDLTSMPNFHGYPISGKTCVHARPHREDLLAAVREDLGREAASHCFHPHHGIRAVRGTQTVDLVFGFGCEQMEIYDDRGLHQITVGASAQRVFDHVLAEYDVPLPPAPGF